jgi:hypothetical protein
VIARITALDADRAIAALRAEAAAADEATLRRLAPCWRAAVLRRLLAGAPEDDPCRCG